LICTKSLHKLSGMNGQKQGNLFLFIGSLVSLLSTYPVAIVEYFTLGSDFQDQIPLKDWLIGTETFFYIHNFLSVFVPTILMLFCIIFIKKYLVSVILTTVFYFITLITFLNLVLSDKFFDSTFSFFLKVKVYFGIYDSPNIILNIIHFLQTTSTLILPLLAILITKSITTQKSTTEN